MKRRSYLFFMSLIIVSTLILGACNLPKSHKKHDTGTETSQAETKEQGSNTKEKIDEQSKKENNTDAKPSFTPAEYTLKDEVLFDNDKCKLVVKDINPDSPFGPELNIHLENKTEKPILITASEASVNAYMINAILYEELEAKSEKEGTISFSGESIQKANIVPFDEIQLNIEARYTDTYEVVMSDTFYIYPTGQNSATVKYSDRETLPTDETIVDEGNLKVVITDLDKNHYMGQALNFYIENNSDKTLKFTQNKVKVNGITSKALASISITPGRKAYHSLYFYTEDLKKNNISEIKEIKFVNTVSDAKDWSADPIIMENISYKVK